jgi:hypothetical protein
VKGSLGLALACAAIQSASAFSVFGPAESWQVPTLDYVQRFYYGSVELGAPKNFGEGSRLNTPIVTYGFDISFLTYFGAKGVAAVDSAMGVLNALPPASSANLSKFLMEGNQQINYTAQAMSLTDLKSTVLSIMLEHMGLAGETHVWDLGSRNPLPGPPPCLFNYAVLNRNYDPATFSYSSVVNGINYYYQIWDGCSNSVSVADAIEATVDATSAAGVTYTAVSTLYGLESGGYYLGLTYDDMGGLRYLYSKNNIAIEALDPNALASTVGSGAWDGVSSTNAAGGAVGAGGVVSNFVGFLGGVEKITYVKMPTDTILGGFVTTPLKFTYTLPTISQNGGLTSVHITRTVFTPDIVFSAGDLLSNTLAGIIFTYSAYARGFGFIANPEPAGAAEVLPSVISPTEAVIFNQMTPIEVNESPSFLDTPSAFGPLLLWGSFDGSTNEPVVYPQTSDISELEAEIFAGGGSSGAESTTWFGITGASTTAAAAGGGGGAP